MTVGELISELQNLPPHFVVWATMDTGVCYPAEELEVQEERVYVR